MSSTPDPALWWARRDLRLADNPALLAAAADGPVLPVFVLDPGLLGRAGPTRTTWLTASLSALDRSLRDRGARGLTVVTGRPEQVVPHLARSVGAARVHVSADFAPYGRRRDQRVATALAADGRALTATGSPYAVAPGTLRTSAGAPFSVFTPFHRAWSEHGVHSPAPAVDLETVQWLTHPQSTPIAAVEEELVVAASEGAARQAWEAWLQRDHDYADTHNLPGRDATSRLSVPLRWGQLHPRTLIADLGQHRSRGGMAFQRQLAWRDFYADVLFHHPAAVHRPLRAEFTSLTVDDPRTNPAAAARFEAWQQGRTGFPLVDAGMRQMLAEHWMHNRVRMLVASFLIKDLHIGWSHGAAWFMAQLRDGDVAQNQLNWQWVAGCGNDAAPYYRVFNPVKQSTTFDPDGAYIRRWVPELAPIDLQYLHEPWTDPQGLPAGYPPPIVDHAAERRDALRRYAEVQPAA